jgi:hypothetical protein
MDPMATRLPDDSRLARVTNPKRAEWRDDLRAASDDEVDAWLDVSFVPPKAQGFGALSSAAHFRGRGAGAKELAWRAVEILASARSVRATELRAKVTSLTLDVPPVSVDLGPLAAFPKLVRLRLEGADTVTGLAAIAQVRHLELSKLRAVDLASLGPLEELFVSSHGGPPVTLTGLDRVRADRIRLAGCVIPEAPVHAAELAVFPPDGADTLAVSGPFERLHVYNACDLTRLRVDAPALRTLLVSCTPTLRHVEGLELGEGLERATFAQVALDTIPSLPAGLRALSVETHVALRLRESVLPAELRTLELRADAPIDELTRLRGLDHLEHLVLGRGTSLEGLTSVLPTLPALTRLTLAGLEIERLPNLDRLAPRLEVLALIACRGFLEHDVLAHMPSLRELRLRGSTLDTHRDQLDPRVRRRGVTVDFAKLDASG